MGFPKIKGDFLGRGTYNKDYILIRTAIYWGTYRILGSVLGYLLEGLEYIGVYIGVPLFKVEAGPEKWGDVEYLNPYEKGLQMISHRVQTCWGNVDM